MKKLIVLNAIALSISLSVTANCQEVIMPDMRKPLPSEWHKQTSAQKSSELIQADSNIEANSEQHERAMLGQEGPRILAIGQSTTISLPSNPTTGYSWNHSCNPENSLDITSKYQKESDLIGASGTQTFTITAKKAGNIMCTFEYGRSWDHNSYKQKKTQAIIVTE